MEAKGITIEQLKTLIATLEDLARYRRWVNGLKSKNGGHSKIVVLKMDQETVHLLNQVGYVEGAEDEYAFRDTHSVCSVPLSHLVDASIPIEQRLESVNDWSTIVTEEGEIHESVTEDGKTKHSITTEKIHRWEKIEHPAVPRPPEVTNTMQPTTCT